MTTEYLDESEEMQLLSIEEKLEFCSNCKNRSFSQKDGVICGLTQEKPSFEYVCSSYNMDETALNRNNLIEDKKTHHEKVVRPNLLWMAIISGVLIYLSYKYFDGLFTTVFIVVGIVAVVKYFDK